MNLVDLVGLMVAIAIASTAAILDIRYRILPNWLCLAAAGCGLLWAAIPFDYVEWLLHVAHVGTALAIGVGLFAIGWWGGGDAKFYAAVAAWFPLTQIVALISWISVAGILLVLGAFILRRGRKRKRGEAGTQLPYGVAIGAGMIASLAQTLIQS